MSERPSLPSHSVPQNLLSFAGEQLQEGWAHVSCCLSVMNDLGQFLSAFHANSIRALSAIPLPENNAPGKFLGTAAAALTVCRQSG